jgi:hypothetical protein
LALEGEKLSFKLLPSGFIDVVGRATPEIVNHPEEKNDLFLP